MMKKKQEEWRKAEESASLRVRRDTCGFIYNNPPGEPLCLRAFVAIVMTERGYVTDKKFLPYTGGEFK